MIGASSSWTTGAGGGLANGSRATMVPRVADGAGDGGGGRRWMTSPCSGGGGGGTLVGIGDVLRLPVGVSDTDTSTDTTDVTAPSSKLLAISAPSSLFQGRLSAYSLAQTPLRWSYMAAEMPHRRAVMPRRTVTSGRKCVRRTS